MNTSPQFDAIIIGAGISGLYELHLLRELGLRVLVLEQGDGVGGVWYWNRYPGARFDSESWSYGYSFDEELLKEWDWTEHFAPQPETERYLNRFADKFDLRRDIQFGTTVTGAHYDEEHRTWTVTDASGASYECRFLITAIGPLSAPTMPRFEGIEDFTGEWHHTGRWPKEPVEWAGKRVAVVGTGASGVQAIAEIAKTAGQLTVFQRRPNWCTPLHNGPISKQEMTEIRANYDDIFARCDSTNSCFIHTPDPRAAMELTEAERNAFWEECYRTPGFRIWQGNLRDVLTDREANRLLSEFVANKIRERVNDPAIAELLIPKDHGFGTRRVPQGAFYYEVYNQPNVRLVSMLETPVQRVTPTGIKTTAEEFEFDLIVYATGFDAVTGAFDAIDFQGRQGRTLKSCWEHGPRSYLGMLVHEFPNLLMLVGPHSSLGNIPRSIEFCAGWVSRLVKHLNEHGHSRVEASEEGQDEWMDFVARKGENLLSNEIDSWMTGVNMNVEGKQVRRLVRYSGSAPEFRALCERVAEGGYAELRRD